MKNFGKGLALDVKKSYPKAFETDKNHKYPILGDYSICNDYDTIILNCYTQKYLGKSKYANDTATMRYNAIRECMHKINIEYKGKHIGLPLIGCGLAGLNWNLVKQILIEELKDMEVSIVHFT